MTGRRAEYASAGNSSSAYLPIGAVALQIAIAPSAAGLRRRSAGLMEDAGSTATLALMDDVLSTAAGFGAQSDRRLVSGGGQSRQRRMDVGSVPRTALVRSITWRFGPNRGIRRRGRRIGNLRVEVFDQLVPVGRHPMQQASVAGDNQAPAPIPVGPSRLPERKELT